MGPSDALELSVSEFVALLNQTLEYAYPNLIINGELANLRVSKNRWLYFDLKDDGAIVKCFGTVYQLPGPLEDGMLLKVRGQPRLHGLYGFSINIQTIQPTGEGTIRRAATLLQAKLAAEGLFEVDRKRRLPYPPTRIGLITSAQSAAYADFIKILAARWRGIQIELIDVQVQGEVATAQITNAIEQFNSLKVPPEVLVVIRGGGSAEDLAAFSTESVTRAIAASRVPTLVGIGHEVDLSLAELAADQQASTPSNAAELLVPDRQNVLAQLREAAKQLTLNNQGRLREATANLSLARLDLNALVGRRLEQASLRLTTQQQLLRALSPQIILRRGYAIVRDASGAVIRNTHSIRRGGIVNVQLAEGSFQAKVNGEGQQ